MANIFDTTTKFKIGDKVRVIGSKRKRIKCPFCNGNYQQEVDGDTFYCANCDEGIMEFAVDDDFTIGIIYGMNVEIRKQETDEDDEVYNTYTTENGFKNVEYYINSEEENCSVGTVNEKKLLEWNKI